MDPVAEVFGRRVRSLRKARGMTQERLAQAAQMDAKHIGAIERGVKTSSFDAVGRLAKALGVDYYQLFVPDHRPTIKVEREVDVMIRDASRIDTANVQEFLRGLRAALRRLDRGRTT
jgi:transcriptional regulator with XRE-family HTH domain